MGCKLTKNIDSDKGVHESDSAIGGVSFMDAFFAGNIVAIRSRLKAVASRPRPKASGQSYHQAPGRKEKENEQGTTL
jgi:hypothetical protein